MIVRFPPSPTGHLHVGNVRTALYNWLLARRHEGRFILRIEDTDAERSTRENEAAVIDDLRWLGLSWDEGPDVGGPNAPYRQSERNDIYRERIDALLERGAAYYCFCSPEQLEAERQKAREEKRPPRYPGTCRSVSLAEAKLRLAEGEEAAIRFRVEQGEPVTWNDLVHGETSFERDEISDFVFVRSDGSPAYNFAVVVDDALMGMTHILRGDDHISNTPRQILLYQAMGFDVPAFGHLPMILGPDGSRLSKRHGATSVSQFREAGFLPEALLNFLALLGWNPGTEEEIFSLDELVQRFSLERVNKAAAVFNMEKLHWLNGQHMRNMSPLQLLPHLQDWMREDGSMPGQISDELQQWYLDLIDTFTGGDTLRDIFDESRMVFNFDPATDLTADGTRQVVEDAEARSVIGLFRAKLAAHGGATLAADSFKALVKATGSEAGVKGKGLFQPVRVAVTGRTSGPELGKLVPLLEAGEALELPKEVLGVRARVDAVCRHLEIT